MRKIIAATGLLVAASLSVAACGQPDGPPESDPVADVEELPGDREFNSVVELRDAVVDLGFPCPEWDQANQISLAASSAHCSEQAVLSVYASDATKGEAVRLLKSMPIIHGFVVGPNWIINAPDSSEWAAKFNAVEVEPSGD